MRLLSWFGLTARQRGEVRRRMSKPKVQGPEGATDSGFALILAILALLLLTFLALTLATTTSTELRIATNYRWSQQAFYNAEAGIEAGRTMLKTMNWSLILPAVRDTPSGLYGTNVGCTPTQNPNYLCWIPVAPPGIMPGGIQHSTPPRTNLDAQLRPSRNYENSTCDMRDGFEGYGVVLDDGNVAAPNQAPYQYITNVNFPVPQSLTGAFTLWVRRARHRNTDGSYSDEPSNPPTSDALVLTAEGIAPFTERRVDADPTHAAIYAPALANSAVKVVEVQVSRSLQAPCGTRSGQAGGSAEGSGFAACDPVTAQGVATGLGIAAAGTSDTGK